MRTKTLLLTAALAAAGIVSSLAQSNVYTVNVVGYVNRDCAGNAGYTLLANPLDSHTNTLNGVLASFLDANSRVLKWNGVGFTISQRTASGWLPPTAGTLSVNPGEGFFVQTPSGGPLKTVTFVGDVLQGSLTNAYTQLYNLSGNLFPDSGTATALGLLPTTGSRILVWNGASYTIYQKTASGWLPPGNGPTINVADGFFVHTAGGTFNWV